MRSATQKIWKIFKNKNGKRKKMKKTLLFNPGPTNVSDDVRNAIKTADICHREKEFFKILDSVRNKILKIVNGEKTHTAIAFVCSATGCNEAIISSIHGKILLINNGEFSDRLGKIARTYNIPIIELKFDPYKQIDLKRLEMSLVLNPDITHIVIVHHETTTGMLLPLREIGKLAKGYNKVLFADTVSSLGGYEIDVKKDNLDFCSVSSNKCLESFPGIAFVIANKEKLKKLKNRSRSFYFNLYRQWEFEEKTNQTPFTPAVQLFFALDKALEELMEEGVENRTKRYAKNAKKMRTGLKRFGFEFVLPNNLQSNILTAIWLPENMDYWQIHDMLKEKGYIIFSGKKSIEKGIFRVATMGHLEEKDIEKFLNDFEKILKQSNFIK